MAGSNTPDSDPTDPPPALIDPSDPDSSTYTIPHKQSDSKCDDSVPCKDSPLQDVDFTEEKTQPVTLPADDGVPPDDFWVERGLDIEERPPVSDWKAKG